MEGRNIRAAVVTGATGMIGSALVKNMLGKGIKVTAFVQPGTKKRDNLPEKHPLLTVREADLSSYDSLGEGMSADAFFHLAWRGPYGEDRNNYDLQIGNIQAALSAVRLAERIGCLVFVGAGTQAEYKKSSETLGPDSPVGPETGYGIAKLAAGEMTRGECRKFGMAHLWTRFFSIYGPGDNAYTMVMSGIYQMLRGERPKYTAGEQLWDYLYADDAAEAMFRAAEYGVDGSVYCIGSGSVRPLADYIRDIRDAVGENAQIGLGERPYFPGQVMHLQADLSSLTRDTGFVPSVPFREGIARTVDWARKQIGLETNCR